MTKPPTAQDVLTVLDELDKIRDDWDALLLAIPCRRCRAGRGEACVRPDGSPYLDTDRYSRERGSRMWHAPRQDVACNLYNSATPEAWRGDLAAGDKPADLMREIRACRLYRFWAAEQAASRAEIERNKARRIARGLRW